MKPVKFSKEAIEELETAAMWYEKELFGLGQRFVNAVEYRIQRLKEPNPPLIPMPGKAGKIGAKKTLHPKISFFSYHH